MNDIASFDMLKSAGIVVLALMNIYLVFFKVKDARRKEREVAESPIMEIKRDIASLKDGFEKTLANHEERLTRDHQRLNELEARGKEHDTESRMVLRGLLALTRHSIDGNNIDGLKAYNEKLKEYLVDK